MIRLTWLQFRPQATHGITPLGCAAFAFTLGVLIGRTVPAMAVALAVFAVIQIAMPLRIRPHLFPAATLPCRHTVIPVTALQDTSLTMRQPAQPGHLLHAISAKQQHRLRGLPRQPRLPGGEQLPARQPLLGLPRGPRPRSTSP